jgi:hypothetical protein
MSRRLPNRKPAPASQRTAEPAARAFSPATAGAGPASHSFADLPAPGQRAIVQAKLTVSQPGDQHEQEADRVAAAVVRGLTAGPGQVAPPAAQIQRSAIGGADLPPETEQAVRQASGGGGQSLPAPIQQQMGAALGADFSGTRIHSDPQADTLSRAISARAFTTGQDVFFRQGEYQPHSPAGQELLAHELTHVVQQGGQPSVQRVVGAPEAEEAEAPEAEAADAPDAPAPMDPAIIAQIEAAVAERYAAIDAQLPDQGALDDVEGNGPAAEAAVAGPVQGQPAVAQAVAEQVLAEAPAEPAPPKPGFFARLFGRGSKPKPAKDRQDYEQIRSRGKKNTVKKTTTVGATVTKLGTAGTNALRAVVPAMNVFFVAKVVPFINMFFTTISTALDLRAAISSGGIAAELKKVAAEAKAQGADDAVVRAIEFAIEQKQTKKVRRYITAFGGVASLGGGIALTAGSALGAVALGALLASNPVGWGIALGLVGLGALVGIGMLGYKIFRWARKKNPGAQREAMATKLHDSWVNDNSASAGKAIRALHLDPDEMKSASHNAKAAKARERSIDQIKRKLGST